VFCSVALLALLCPFPAIAAEAPKSVNFSIEHKWTLKELNPDLPSDWSPYEFLVLELKASSPERFELGFDTPNGLITKRIHPLPGVWIRASIPLNFFRNPPGDGSDLAATMNKPRNSYWINVEQGGHGSLTNVQAITVGMPYPVGTPTLEIRSVRLSKEDPGDAVLEGKPLIDEFGQYIHAEWTGKARSLDDLKKAWTAETESLANAHATDRCPYGGFANTKAKATGFFHVEQIDGRWWFVCPEGHLFFSSGANGIGAAPSSRTTGREDLFASLPPAGPTNAAPGGFGRGFGPSFYSWNLQRRYGDDWRPKAAVATLRRMEAWGLNTLYGRDPQMAEAQPRKPYIMNVRGWQAGRAIMGMPDVYSEEFSRRVEETAAAQCEPRKDDPWLIGYFIGNEPPWPGRESQLVDMILAGPESAMQKELKTWLANGDTPERRKEFVLRAFERYLDAITKAVKKHDPNHLNLGIRFGGKPPAEVIQMAKVFDVYSHNIYAYAPNPEFLDKCYQLTGRPILIGEFHIGAPGRGLAPGLVQAADQSARGVAYRYYVEHAAAHPAVIGAHWFQWIDEPATGRMDGENYNIGILDVTDRPYREMIEAMQATHARLLDVHSGKTPPVNRLPEGKGTAD
jgi:hypothetical protein